MCDERSFKPVTLKFEDAYPRYSYAPLVAWVLRTQDRLGPVATAHPYLARIAAVAIGCAPIALAAAALYHFA